MNTALPSQPNQPPSKTDSKPDPKESKVITEYIYGAQITFISKENGQRNPPPEQPTNQIPNQNDNVSDTK